MNFEMSEIVTFSQYSNFFKCTYNQLWITEYLYFNILAKILWMLVYNGVKIKFKKMF